MDNTKLYTHEELLEFVLNHVTVIMNEETGRNNYGGYSTMIVAKAVLSVPGEPDMLLSQDYYFFSD